MYAGSVLVHTECVDQTGTLGSKSSFSVSAATIFVNTRISGQHCAFRSLRFSRHWNVQFAFEILGGAGFFRELWIFQSTLEFPSRLRGCQWHTSKATKVHAVCVVVFFNFLYSFNATGACRGWLGDGDSTRLTKLTGYTMCCPVQKVKAVGGI